MAAFAKLLDDPGQIGRVTLAIEKAIEASFAVHKMRHMTTAEIKRRFDMAAAIFEKLRGELKWGIDRALDKLPEYLGAELSGSSWTPDTRQIWTPADGG